jgi:hypothetical protein
MKQLFAALILASLAGCSGPAHMTNDAIISEAMKCEQAGLPWRQVFSPYDGTVVGVYCSPHMRPLSRSAL